MVYRDISIGEFSVKPTYGWETQSENQDLCPHNFKESTMVEEAE